MQHDASAAAPATTSSARRHRFRNSARAPSNQAAENGSPATSHLAPPPVRSHPGSHRFTGNRDGPAYRQAPNDARARKPEHCNTTVENPLRVTSPSSEKAQSSPFRDRSREAPCRFFTRSSGCRDGAECRFAHHDVSEVGRSMQHHGDFGAPTHTAVVPLPRSRRRPHPDGRPAADAPKQTHVTHASVPCLPGDVARPDAAIPAVPAAVRRAPHKFMPLGFAPYTSDRKTGAGILFVSNDGVHLYLGKNRTKDFAEFGGRAEPVDRSPFDTAVRETSEEAFGVMDRFLRREDWVKDNLLETIDMGGYMCFVIRLPADVNLPAEFDAAAATSAEANPEMTGVAAFDAVMAIAACRRKGGLAVRADGVPCVLRGRTRLVLQKTRTVGKALVPSDHLRFVPDTRVNRVSTERSSPHE
jgi:hypothetical protein